MPKLSKDAQHLFEGICKLAQYSMGFYSYPDHEEATHLLCLDLERKGLILRQREGDGWILWGIKKEKGITSDEG